MSEKNKADTPHPMCSTCAKKPGACGGSIVTDKRRITCLKYERRNCDNCYCLGCTDYSLWSRPKSAAGGRKDDSGKLRWGLVPIEPLEQVVEVFNVGAEKYGERNWEKGISWLKVWEAAMRHLTAWRQGEDNDPEDGLPHLAHAGWNCLALLEYRNTRPELDDRGRKL